VTGPPRTVDEVAAPYVNFLVRVPPAGPGVCSMCHSIVSGYTTCYQCHQGELQLGNAIADLTAFVSMAPRNEQLAHELIAYKDPKLRAEDRQWMTVGLAAVLWKWLGLYEACLVSRLRIGSFDLITSVPSTTGRLNHPLRTVVAGVVSNSSARYQDLLILARDGLPQHVHSADRFRATRSLAGARVLVIEDSWTMGGNARSASAALKTVGARTVAIVTIGRWFNPAYADAVSWLAEHRNQAGTGRGAAWIQTYPLTVSCATCSVRDMTPGEAERMLSDWVMITRDRDSRVRAAIAAGVSKHRVHQLTGIGRSTIDRILSGPAPSGTIDGPSGGQDDH